MLKKNNFASGAFAGIIASMLGWLLVGLLGKWLNRLMGVEPFFQLWQMYFLGLILPILLMRYYFINRKMDKAGKGVLLIIFVLGMGYFAYLKIKGYFL